jgi:N-acetylglutamate synthase-like GNAT family acetyltransferase|tara:strand:+ start:3885 stop:4691 length:807 start_codon:yes stop_codon:yes gene_type:complete
MLYLAKIREPNQFDKQQVLDFCQNTFSWGDYIEEVWDSWYINDGLVVIEENGKVIGMAHGVIYKNEKMLWLEGIRVNEKYRKNGFATCLIEYFERKAKDSHVTHLNMLIESENTASLNLTKKLGYKKISKWNYFSLESRKNDSEQTEFHDVSFNELNDTANIRFVESWRWIPITEASFNKLSHNILCLKKNGKINSLAIITESNSFRDTIILTIIFGSDDDIKKMILYTQNTSFTKNYSKIRILTEKENLMISNTGNKFPFYLVEKIL